MSAPARLLQLHGVIVDLIYRVEAVPRPGSETIVHGFDMSPGGGYNAMVAAKRSGLTVIYAGSLGTGPLSEMVRAALDAEEIECLHPRDSERDQGCCSVMIDEASERTFVAAEGAEGHIAEPDLRRIATAEFDWSLISGYTLYYKGSGPALTRWLEVEPKIPNLVFDPGPLIASVRPEAIAAVLSRAAWVSANAAEAAVLTSERNPLNAAQRLAEDRAGGAVVRLGSEGSIVAWDGRHRRVPGNPVVAVDTNGAGDAHIGAFIAALARGQDAAEAALYANIAAAISTTQHGPATAPDLTTIEETLRLKEAG
ncbi:MULTISPECIES: PfkB family carbohydrate kinase [unclassified Ruegeria]|uniref:PfkB family carbohydrate kinase n=1 Tax=unclassified Ruegeria TaxID=2625375 RepID=UPI001489520E|nr:MULTISPECIES: PfkB family carbohydrate kinase [unclassified Ruegeria]